MKHLHKILLKYKWLLVIAVFLCPLPIAVISQNISNFFFYGETIINANDVFSFYAVILSILFTFVGIIVTIDIALKDKSDKDRSDTIPVLAFEPFSGEITGEDITRLLITSSSVTVVSSAPKHKRADYFHVINFSGQSAIHVKLRLGSTDVLLGSLLPYQKRGIAFYIDNSVVEDMRYHLALTCRTVQGEIIDYISHYSVDVSDDASLSIGIILMPQISPVSLQSTTEVNMPYKFFGKQIERKKVRTYEDTTKQEVFK